jgi:hypothetical protein
VGEPPGSAGGLAKFAGVCLSSFSARCSASQRSDRSLNGFLLPLGEGEDEGAFELGSLTSVLSRRERKWEGIEVEKEVSESWPVSLRPIANQASGLCRR